MVSLSDVSLANKKLWLVIGIGFLLLMLVILLSFARNKPTDSTAASTEVASSSAAAQVNTFEKAKKQIYTSLTAEKTRAVSVPVPPSRSYAYQKAKITYLPLPNIFTGTVENALNIEDYRRNKRALVSHLSHTKTINVCDLDIFWKVPASIETNLVTPEDLVSDGCTP